MTTTTARKCADCGLVLDDDYQNVAGFGAVCFPCAIRYAECAECGKGYEIHAPHACEVTTPAPTTHRVRWYVYATDGLGARELIPHVATMRGTWGFEAKCSCGWQTHTGGAIRSYIRREIWFHKIESEA